MEEINKTQLIIIKICCVVASFVLWLYIFNIENPVRERKIVVPVKIINKDVLIQSKLVAVGEENLNITLRIRGNASDVYAVKPSDFQLQSDLGSYVVKKGENKIPVEVKKSPGNARIANDDNLWIKIVLDDLKEKPVPVKVILGGKAKNGFFSMQPVVNPKEVSITGAKEAVKNVASVVARYDISNASKDIETNLELQAEDASGAIVKNISVNPSSVQVNIPIRKVKTVPINIKTTGSLPTGEAIKSLIAAPEKIEISGEESVLSTVNAIDTEPIDLSKLGGKDVTEAKLLIPKQITLVNSSGTINVKIGINKGIEKEFSLDIKGINLNAEYTATLESNKVSVVLSGNAEIINNLSVDKIEASVDMSSLTEGEHTVPININIPEGTSKVSQNLANIKVVISKKAVEGKNGN